MFLLAYSFGCNVNCCTIWHFAIGLTSKTPNDHFHPSISISLARVDFKPWQGSLFFAPPCTFVLGTLFFQTLFPSFLLTKLPAFSAARARALSVCLWPELWLHQDGQFQCVCVCVSYVHTCMSVHVGMCVPNNEVMPEHLRRMCFPTQVGLYLHSLRPGPDGDSQSLWKDNNSIRMKG